MGDHANVFVLDWQGKRNEPKEARGTYLYTHWDGCDLPFIVQRALARRQRWNDNSYLTRIIFCEMVRNDIDGETGYGISPTIGDNEHPIIVVDPNNQQVGFAHEDSEPDCYVAWSFTDFVELNKDEIMNEFALGRSRYH